MQKKNNDVEVSSRRSARKGLQRLVFSAFLAALSIVLGKYLAIPIGPVLRFSFENLPVIMGGIIFGPIAGALIGVIADLVGCVLVGYAINPVITAGAAVIGLCSGILYRVCKRFPLFLRIFASVTVSHLIGSVLIKTWGLSAFYDMPFLLLMLWRMLNYVVVGCAECGLLYYLFSHKTISDRIVRLQG